MRRPALLLALSCMLAGCAGGAGDAAGPQAAGGDPTLGALEGIVVDDAVRPVAGANVTATGAGGVRNATSDADGRFAITGLEPGNYVVVVSKEFYNAHQLSVDVRAGEAADLVRFQLVFEPRSIPYANLYKFEGYFECGVWPTNGCANINILTGIVFCSLDIPCFNVTSDRSVELIPIDGVPDFLQSEMTWEPTTASGEALLFGLGHATRQELQDGFAEGDNFTEGPSPLLLTLDNATLADASIGNERMLLIQVSTGVTYAVPGGCPEFGDPCGAGVVVQQPYTTFTHAFFGYLPPPDWRFTQHGAPPPPD